MKILEKINRYKFKKLDNRTIDCFSSDNCVSIVKELLRCNVKNIDLAYYTKLGFGYNVYIFELDKNKDELVIHYYNELLSTRKAIEEWEMGKIDDTIEIERFGDGYMMTKKKEFYIKNRDYVRVPLKNFAKEIIKISEDYFEFIKSIEIARGYYDWFYGKDEHCLEQRIKNVKKFYRKRYGEEL